MDCPIVHLGLLLEVGIDHASDGGRAICRKLSIDEGRNEKATGQRNSC